MRWKRSFNQSLLARALFSNFVLVGVSVTLLTGLFLFVQLRAIQTQMDLRAKVLAGFVAAQSDFAMLVGDRADLERIARSALSIEDVLFVVLTYRGGESIRVSRPGFPPEKIPALGQDPRIFQIVQPVLARTGSSVVEWENQSAPAGRLGTVRIGFSLERQQELSSRTLRFSVPMVLLSLIVILAVQYAQLRRLLEPLKDLIAFTRQVGQGQRSIRAAVKRPDEVGRLAEAFNRMVEELGSTTVSKDYVNNIIRSMGEALLVIGPHHTIRTVNQATLSLLGYSEAELLDLPAARILGDENLGEIAGAAGVERVYRRKDGTAVPVLFSASPMLGEDGACEGHVCLAQDITARKLAEEELREAKRQAETANRAKSDLLSRTSHELRTPLNAILGFGQLLELSELSPEDRESVDRIMTAGRHLLRLINEVLDIAGMETGRRTVSREPVHIGEVAFEALDMVGGLAGTQNIEIRASLECCDDRYVWADRQRLQQVLLNLLSNAIKYNRPGGTVTLAGRQNGAETIRLAVTDTGLGIPPEGLAKLFVPFERLGAAETGIEGTGLGLTLSKIFVDAMGGSIGVESTVGQGTTFWLDLSVAAAPGEAASRPDSSSGEVALEECGERTVLYIEDNLSNVELVERLLRRFPSFQLLSATRGEQGVELARERLPDLILLDLHLPDIWGDEVLRRLRADAATHDIPVVMLSADATGDQVRRLLAAGAGSYLTKPLDCQELLRTIHACLKTGGLINA
jgi:PAS domain S-box-containing protein